MNTTLFKPLCIRVTLILAFCASHSHLQADTTTAKQVRSLLSNRCFICHGPDEEQRKGGYRLDDSKSAFEPADSGERPIVAGDPAKSELLRRLISNDDSERMPPPEFGAKFTKEEVALIEQWIRDGAKWEQHWSFIAPTRSPLPEAKV
ncbi:MAG: c-type cytochrome domain-containing protein, partial [Pirellulaceae bacterium]|nr:c-type cytochrome domain-containing protein [Pirellulaceae bacterium]